MDAPAKTEASVVPPMADATGRIAFAYSSEVVMLSDSRGARAEAIRTLRTYIMAQHVEDGRRGLAVCAASGEVGATFVAVNLAVALAQIGVKVLLIDGDLRHAQIDSFVRPDRRIPGLRDYLEAEEAELAASVQSDVIENLSVMFAGEPINNAQELLASDRFSNLIERCLRDYDLTIIDTPPANGCADARRISTVVGYSLIAAKRHHSFVGDVRALAAQLRQDRAQIVGTVLNEA